MRNRKRQPNPNEINTSHWTVADAMSVRETSTNRVPAYDPLNVIQVAPGGQFWDDWNASNEDNVEASVLGLKVLIALTRPEGADFSQGERIGYFYSKDGLHYEYGGLLIGDHKLYHDIREWSGSTYVREDGLVQTFYTCSYGTMIDGVWQTVQRLATIIHEPYIDDDGALKFKAPVHHALLGGVGEPDGIKYETPRQASTLENMRPTHHRPEYGDCQAENNCNRDIFKYVDKRTGKAYGLFEGNTGPEKFPAGEVRAEYISLKRSYKDGFSPTVDMLKANGCVGVIEFTNDDCTFGVFRDPWLTANLSTDEIERINVIDHDGHVYLFVVTHGNKNAAMALNSDLQNRDCMLGWRADYFGGPLTPLNGNGVVLQQKSFGDAYVGQEQNQQYTYSWKLVKSGDQATNVFRCLSYSNYCNAGGEVKPVMNPGPSFFIEISGLDTRVVGMKYDILPA